MSLSLEIQSVTIEYAFNLTEAVRYTELRDDNRRTVFTFHKDSPERYAIK